MDRDIDTGKEPKDKPLKWEDPKLVKLTNGSETHADGVYGFVDP
ncbi:hypothetical protein ACFL6S_26815 [Candidatus Poribacteria bacterium]